jgi:hypothetical protein
MMPFLNSVEIQAHAPAITAMTIKENAIDPRSSATFFLPRHVFYLVGDPAMTALLFAFFLASCVEIKSCHFNQSGQAKNNQTIARSFAY